MNQVVDPLHWIPTALLIGQMLKNVFQGNPTIYKTTTLTKVSGFPEHKALINLIGYRLTLF